MDQNYTVVLSASEPTYYQFLFPGEVTNVLLTVTSDDDICMSVSIQNLTVKNELLLIQLVTDLSFIFTQCPVFDMDSDIKYEGIWQTLMNKTGMTISVIDYTNSIPIS